MSRQKHASGRPAPGERHVVVVDRTGELARLLLRQRERAERLREDANSARSLRAAPAWLDSVMAWRRETTRILADWFDREVVTEFAVATSTGHERDRLAERVRSARNGLRNGTELIKALHSTQTAARRNPAPPQTLPVAGSTFSDPRQIA